MPHFVVGVLFNGLTGPGMNTPLNICAARVEQAVGRAIMPHFHASFSIGAAVGALVAAACSALHIPVAAQLAGVAALGVLLRLVLAGPGTALAPAHEPARSGARGSIRTALGAWGERRTVLIGLVLLAGALSEGSANNWLSIAVVDGFEVREAIGAAAYGTFVGAMTVVRLGGTRLIDRFGRVAVLRASGAFGLAGLLAFGLVPTWWLAFGGVLLWGMGSALASPVAMAAAADEPERAAARVSVATSFMSMASITAPPLLGLLADAVGARHALLVICAAMVLSMTVAGQVRPPVGTRR